MGSLWQRQRHRCNHDHNRTFEGATIQDSRQVFLAQIRYVEWNVPGTPTGMLDVVTRKEISYAHEAEMRAFLWDRAYLVEPQVGSPLDHPVGQALAIDPQELIAEVWIGPREKSWIQPLVERIVAVTA